MDRPKTLSEIVATEGVGNVNFDPMAQDDEGEIEIGADWYILCAPRPLVGTITWTNASEFPMFWAAVDFESEFGPGYLERDRRLDATQVIYVIEAHVREKVQAYYDEKWPGRVDINDHGIRDIWDAFVRHAAEWEEGE
jgi:hypothetical protein